MALFGPTTDTSQRTGTTSNQTTSQTQSGTSFQSGTQNMTPEQRAWMARRNQLLDSYLGPLGGDAGYFSSTNPFALTPEAETMRQGIMGYLPGAAASLGRNPYEFGAGGFTNNPLLNQLGSFYSSALDRTGTASTVPTIDLSGTSVTPGHTSFIPTATNYAPADLSAYATNWRASDPAAAEQAATDIMTRIVTPGLVGQMATKGMGRSGAEEEAITQAGTQMALPIAQQTQSEIFNRQQQIYLQNVAASLQAQQLTAKSQSEYNQIQAQLDAVNAEMATRASQTGAGISGQAAIEQARLGAAAQENAATRYANMVGAGLNLGSHLADQAAAWQMGAPAAIMNLAGQGMGIAQLPNTLGQAGLQNRQQMLLGLLGQTPMPPGGTSTQEGRTTGTTTGSLFGNTAGTQTGTSTVSNPLGSIGGLMMGGAIAAPGLLKALKDLGLIGGGGGAGGALPNIDLPNLNLSGLEPSSTPGLNQNDWNLFGSNTQSDPWGGWSLYG